MCLNDLSKYMMQIYVSKQMDTHSREVTLPLFDPFLNGVNSYRKEFAAIHFL